MQPQEKQLIDALFQKIGQAATQSGPRDPEVETLIGQHLQRLPSAPYYLAQAIIVQRQALKQAEARIAELERRAGGQRSAGEPVTPRQQAARSRPVAGREGGGGFLAGAAQTALGIGGGILLADAATSLVDGVFGGSYSADDLFDAYEAGAEESIVDDAIFEAGYDEAVSDLGSDLLGRDFLGDDTGWDDDW